MAKVIVLDKISKQGLALLDAAEGIEYEVRTGLKGEDLRTALAEFDGAIVRSGVKITAESLEGNRRLKAIVRAGVGVDNIDRQKATRLGIVVMNTPAGNTISTAEHAFALMLALSRNVAAANQSLVEGRWDRSAYMGAQLAEKTLGIVGLGRIGTEVAKRAMAFAMRVIAYDPFLSAEAAEKLGIERVETVHDMLPRIDYLTVHTPLTPETKHLIGAKEIELMKPSARLINGARGGIYDEAALVEGLKSGKLAGVALDVFENEPCTSSPLFGMKNVVCTPHLGASTEEAQTLVAVEGVQLLVNFLKTGEIRHSVNVVPIQPQTLASLRGYLDVAYRLGRLLAQVHDGGLESCTLQYRGEVADKETRLLTAAFCAGLAEGAMEDEVNIVNAELLLRERGIQIKEETQSKPSDFSSTMTASVTSRGQTFNAAGTLFGNNMPRLIRLNDYRFEAYLDGNLLSFVHSDVPGVIGAVGTVFGKHGVNIAQMSVGRESEHPGGEAIGVLNLDSLPPPQAIEEVLATPGVLSVKVFALPASGQLPSWLQ
ncbi:MAG: phosphoglycerate dehydrogenase [Candidatus Anammoximicrobium sp.]|nr:phosphoglycerate dehydrogenase [Candidatus Anammoximicrobium sp.]